MENVKNLAVSSLEYPQLNNFSLLLNSICVCCIFFCGKFNWIKFVSNNLRIMQKKFLKLYPKPNILHAGIQMLVVV